MPLELSRRSAHLRFYDGIGLAGGVGVADETVREREKRGAIITRDSSIPAFALATYREWFRVPD